MVSSGTVVYDCLSSCPNPLVMEDCGCSVVTVALIIDSYGVLQSMVACEYRRLGFLKVDL